MRSVWPMTSALRAELPLPVAVADDGHQRRAGFVVFAREQTAERRTQAERLVVAAGDQRAPGTRLTEPGAPTSKL